jgi:hypothetical protein
MEKDVGSSFLGRSKKFWITIGLFLFLGSWITCGFCHIWYRQKILRIGQHIHNIEAEILQLQRRESLLLAKIAQIHSPITLRTYATDQLIEPKFEKFTRISWQDVRAERQRMAQNHPSKQKYASLSEEQFWIEN